MNKINLKLNIKNLALNVKYCIQNTDYQLLKTVLLFAFCFCPFIAKSDTHYVSKKGNDIYPYKTLESAANVIQDAVNAASNGDTVLVDKGIYRTGKNILPGQTLPNRVIITNSIILKSIHGPKKTRIVGRKGVGIHNIRCLYANAVSNIQIIGFKISNGGNIETEESSYEEAEGAGMYVVNTLVSNCIVINNRCFDNREFNSNEGGGIYAENSRIISCLIAKNRSQWGGGISCNNSFVYDCKFFNNIAVHGYYDWEYKAVVRDGSGGGAVLDLNSTIENCYFKGNLAASTGGGIEAYENSKIINCKVIRNRTGVPSLADYVFGGAGIFISDGIISNTIIYKNIASNPLQEYGGGIWAYDSKIYNVIVEKNKAIGGKWEGVGSGGIDGNGTVFVYNSIINNNKTAGLEAYAGGVFNCNLYNCIVINNKTSGKDSWAGGVYKCNINNSIIRNNKAKEDPNFYDSTINYSCVESKPEGKGNFDADPLFVNEKKGDFHLQENSPCIDAGKNSDWMYGTKDLDNKERLYNKVDLGPYEKQGDFFGYFVAQYTNGPVSLNSIFTAYVSGTNVSDVIYKWDLDNDGIFDIEGKDKKSFSYNYPYTGVYSVLLSIKNSKDNTKTFLKENCVHAYSPVKADFIAEEKSTNYEPSTFQFTDLSTNYPHFWAYDFEDDGIIDSINQNPIFTYEHTGTFSVTLITSNDFGNNNSSFDVITKTNLLNITDVSPIPNFSYDDEDSKVFIYETINFTDESLYADSWAWDFDNNGTIDSTEQNPSFYYTNSGYKTIKLTVSNPNGNSYIKKIKAIAVRNSNYIHYVSTSGSSVFPYDSWETAANYIADAVDASSDCDLVLINEGTYYITNFLEVEKDISIKSFYGMTKTILDLSHYTIMFNDYPIELSGKFVFDGFTVQNATNPYFYAAINAYGGIIQNCLFKCKNTAIYIYHGIIQNSIFVDNDDNYYDIICWLSDIQNCTIYNNSYLGLLMKGGSLQNSIVWSDNETFLLEGEFENINNCIKGWSGKGVGIINDNPQFVSENDFHLQASSPCINTGTNMSYVFSSTDLDGNPRLSGERVDIGAYEFNTNMSTDTLSYKNKKRKVLQLYDTIWNYKNKKNKDVIIGKNISLALEQFFCDGWLIGLADGTTTDNFNGPHKLVAKSNDKKWRLQPTNFVDIKYFPIKNELIYILRTNMPESKMIYLLPENYDKTNLIFIKNKLLIPIE